MSLPVSEEEIWRYSPIDELDFENYQPQRLDDPPGFEMGLTTSEEAIQQASIVSIENGWLTGVSLTDEAIEAGIFVGPAGDIEDGERLFRASVEQEVDVFGYLNQMLCPQPVLIKVPSGIRLESPIVLVFNNNAERGIFFPKVIVDISQDASATVVELHASMDIEALVVPVLEVMVSSDSHFRHGMLQTLEKKVWQIGKQNFQIGASSKLETFTAGIGGGYVRTHSNCRLVGRGSEARLVGAYYGEDQQIHDFRTFQEHIAPDTTSDLLFKGVLDGSSRSVYSGLIRIQPEATRTRANQSNKNIKLSDKAWAESVPNLEIETDDVMCSHASTVSPIDEEQIFYLESRGLTTEIAERLVIEGFFDDVVSTAPTTEFDQRLRTLITGRLHRRSQSGS